MPRARATVFGALLAVGVAAAQRPTIHHFPTATAVSAESPFAASCNGTQTGRNFRNAAVETWLAVDPRDPQHIVGTWQQDRWSNGGASGLIASASFDGGRTWTRAPLPFSACATAASPFVRASDPWVSISPGGTVHAIGLALNGPNNSHAMQASRSTDGGLHWSAPVTILEERGADILNDKESLTADPLDARYVYAVWDRLSGLTSINPNNFRGPSYFSRTTDGGVTWEPARQIFDAGANGQTIANQIVVLPDGTLVNGFVWITNAAAPLVRDERLRIAILRSPDRGLTWTGPFLLDIIEPIGVSDVKTGVPVRSGAAIPAIAVDPQTGALYCTWQDGRFSGGKREGIAFSRSTDGGLTWSTPIQINQVTEVQAFTPSIAAANGLVAVTYYDFRKDTDEKARLWTSCWRLVSSDGGQSWTEAPVAEPFDLAAAPLTDGAGYFVGDYQGLAVAGSRFLSFFALSGPGDIPSAVFATTRPSGSDRTSTGRTEVNRFVLRRHPEVGKKR